MTEKTFWVGLIACMFTALLATILLVPNDVAQLLSSAPPAPTTEQKQQPQVHPENQPKAKQRPSWWVDFPTKTPPPSYSCTELESKITYSQVGKTYGEYTKTGFLQLEKTGYTKTKKPYKVGDMLPFGVRLVRVKAKGGGKALKLEYNGKYYDRHGTDFRCETCCAPAAYVEIFGSNELKFPSRIGFKSVPLDDGSLAEFVLSNNHYIDDNYYLEIFYKVSHKKFCGIAFTVIESVGGCKER